MEDDVPFGMLILFRGILYDSSNLTGLMSIYLTHWNLLLLIQNPLSWSKSCYRYHTAWSQILFSLYLAKFCPDGKKNTIKTTGLYDFCIICQARLGCGNETAKNSSKYIASLINKLILSGNNHVRS